MMTQDKAAAIATARRLLRECGRATLATAMRNDDGAPYPSFVLIACDGDGAPLLFVSALAEHTRNLQADPRAGLLLQETDGLDDPLTGTRLTLSGRIDRADTPERRARFLARHPTAERLAGLGDFAVHRMTVVRGYLIAGFGRARGLSAEELGLRRAGGVGEGF